MYEQRNFDLYSEVHALLRELNDEEYDKFFQRLGLELAFSTGSITGLDFKENKSYCYLLLDKYSEDSAKFGFAPTKEAAIHKIDEFHDEQKNVDGRPKFSELDEEWQKAICFEVETYEKPVVKGSKPLIELSGLDKTKQIEYIVNHEKFQRRIQENINQIRNNSNSFVSRNNFQDVVSVRDSKTKLLHQKIRDRAVYLESRIVDWSKFHSRGKNLRKFYPNSSETTPNYFFLNTALNLLNGYDRISIAEVLSISHPELEKHYLSEEQITGKRASIDLNPVHGVKTDSNVIDVIREMTTKGFDNQPIYCSKRKKCIASIRLKDALLNLKTKRYSGYESFENYTEMISKNLLSPPPPVFSSTDSFEVVLSVFEKGCEAVVFEFRSSEWESYGLDPKISEILEDGLHIMTPHDITHYLLTQQ